MTHRSDRHGGPSKAVDIVLVPTGKGAFIVRATNRGGRYPYTNNPIGGVRQNPDGSWAYTYWPGQYFTGALPTALKAAQECYRSHRSWVGY